MATLALAPYHDGPRCHFVSNVDGAHIADTLAGARPATHAGHRRLEDLHHHRDDDQRPHRPGLDAGDAGELAGSHFAAVSTALDRTAAFGIDPARVFGFWDWVGGRYSVWGAVGLPVMIAVGPERLRRVPDRRPRDGPALPARAAAARTCRCCSASSASGTATSWATRPAPSCPTTSACCGCPPTCSSSTWNRTASASRSTARPSTTATGPVVWGEPGTNGQHAFYQLIHQGTEVVPCEFMVAADGHEPALDHQHELLLANCLAQSEALMRGRSLAEARDDRERPRASAPAQGLPRQPPVDDARSTPSSTRAPSAGSSRSTSTGCSSRA